MNRLWRQERPCHLRDADRNTEGLQSAFEARRNPRCLFFRLFAHFCWNSNAHRRKPSHGKMQEMLSASHVLEPMMLVPHHSPKHTHIHTFTHMCACACQTVAVPYSVVTLQHGLCKCFPGKTLFSPCENPMMQAQQKSQATGRDTDSSQTWELKQAIIPGSLTDAFFPLPRLFSVSSPLSLMASGYVA